MVVFVFQNHIIKRHKKEVSLFSKSTYKTRLVNHLGNLPVGDRCNHRHLSNALEERFLPPNQMELYRAQLLERRQSASESLPELGQDIRRLVNLAYPTAPIEVRETLAKEQFIDALKDSEMRLRFKQARPIELNDAIRHAVELDAFNSAERRLNETKGYLRELKSQEKAETGDTRFILDTDASSFSIEAVLSQVQEGIEPPIAFASRSLTKSEKKYCVKRK